MNTATPITNSHGFVSYPRHEYFRRTLCHLLDASMVRGEIPADSRPGGSLVKNVRFAHARDYFGLEFVPEFSAKRWSPCEPSF